MYKRGNFNSSVSGNSFTGPFVPHHFYRLQNKDSDIAAAVVVVVTAAATAEVVLAIAVVLTAAAVAL
jgi:spore germination protein YaaH